MKRVLDRIMRSTKFGAVLLMLAPFGIPVIASAANNAVILEQESQVPQVGSAGNVVRVRIRARNNGTSTWRSHENYRLGALAQNQLAWASPRCGGYSVSTMNARAYLCHDVRPGTSHDFEFDVRMPSSGSRTLSVRMVRDGVQWFGEGQNFTLNVGSRELPDLVLESQRIEPSQPKPGDSVRFISVVRNQGSAATPSGKEIGVGYLLDNRWVSYGIQNRVLAPGAAMTLTTQGSRWTATGGRHTFTAVVDDVNRFPESNEGNNSRSMSFDVSSSSACPNAPLGTPSDRWKLEVFNNRFLTDAPVETRYDAAGNGGFSFNWGSSGPSRCTGVDDFGLRLTRRVQLSQGRYRFSTTTDDGVRLWVDGRLVIDRWVDQAPTNHTGSIQLDAGQHELRFDYYERGGGAVASLSWQKESTGGGGEVGLFAMNIDPANPKGNPSAAEIQDLGASWVRIEYKERLGGIQGNRDRIRKYHDAGVRVLLIADYAMVPGKPAGTTRNGWDAYRGRFRSKLDEVARELNGIVDAWQIWNEPDHLPKPGYDVYVPPEHFGHLLTESVAVIGKYSNAPVVAAGLASGDPRYLDQAANAAGGLTVDAIAVHPYGQRPSPGWRPPGQPNWGFGDMSALFDRYRAVSRGKPIWVTEIGLNTTDQGLAADYMEKTYHLAASRSDVRTVFWFCWSDGMVPSFGILDADGGTKASYHKYRELAR